MNTSKNNWNNKFDLFIINYELNYTEELQRWIQGQQRKYKEKKGLMRTDTFDGMLRRKRFEEEFVNNPKFIHFNNNQRTYSITDGDFVLTEDRQYVKFNSCNKRRQGCIECYKDGIKRVVDRKTGENQYCKMCQKKKGTTLIYVEAKKCDEITWQNIRYYLLNPVRTIQQDKTPRKFFPENSNKFNLEKASCGKCKLLLPVKLFTYNSTNKFNINTICKDCDAKYKKQYKETIQGFFSTMFDTMTYATKLRKQCKMTWTKKEFLLWVVDEIERTQGKCYYSQLEYSFDRKKGGWCISPERLDNKKNYCPTNVKFILKWFQTTDLTKGIDVEGSSQWTITKFQNVPILSNKINTLEYTAYIDRILIECEEDLQLTRNQRSGRCQGKGRRVSILTQLIVNKMKHIRKSIKSRFVEDAKRYSDIDEKWILEYFKATRFRCYYSNIIMGLDSSKDWFCSIERKDQTIGYTKENTVFTCIEFNTNNQFSRKTFKEIWNIDIDILK